MYKIYSKSREYSKNHGLEFSVTAFNSLEESEPIIKSSYRNDKFGVTINLIELYSGFGNPLGIYSAAIYIPKEEFESWGMKKFSEFMKEEFAPNSIGNEKKYNFLTICFEDGTGYRVIDGEATYGIIDKSEAALIEYCNFGKIRREYGEDDEEKYKYYTKLEWDKFVKSK